MQQVRTSRFGRSVAICAGLAALIGVNIAPAFAQNGAHAPNAFGRTDDQREGALDSYDNTTTNDVLALVKLLQQEVYINQQKSTMLEFRLAYGDRIDLKSVFYPSGSELIPGHIFTPKAAQPNKKNAP